VIGELDLLRAFTRPHWKYHHPVSPEQLAFGEKTDSVRSVSFCHGGDVLYELVVTPGLWHEECLLPEGSLSVRCTL